MTVIRNRTSSPGGGLEGGRWRGEECGVIRDDGDPGGGESSHGDSGFEDRGFEDGGFEDNDSEDNDSGDNDSEDNDSEDGECGDGESEEGNPGGRGHGESGPESVFRLLVYYFSILIKLFPYLYRRIAGGIQKKRTAGETIPGAVSMLILFYIFLNPGS